MCGFFPNQKICGILKIFLEYSEADGGLADRFFYFRFCSKTLSSHETFFSLFSSKSRKTENVSKKSELLGTEKKGGLGFRVNARRFYDQTSTFSLKNGVDRGTPVSCGPKRGKKYRKIGLTTNQAILGRKM